MESITNFLKWLFLTPSMEMTILHYIVFTTLTIIVIVIIVFSIALVEVLRDR